MGIHIKSQEDTRDRGSTCSLLDYPHSAIWCPGCYGYQQQARTLKVQEDLVRQMERQNELAEIALMQGPNQKGTSYTPFVPAKPRPVSKGGMRVAPRTEQ